MIAIIYLNNEPFYCFLWENFDEDYPFKELIIDGGIKFKVLNRFKQKNSLHFNCMLKKYDYEILESDFLFQTLYEQTPGNIKPIWVENNYGKQITFLIE